MPQRHRAGWFAMALALDATAELASAQVGIDGIRFGRAACVVPDQDGDGLEDFVVTAPRAGRRPWAGRVYVFSSAGPARLACFDGPSPDAAIGGRVEWIRRGAKGGALLVESEYRAGCFVYELDGTVVGHLARDFGGVRGVGDWNGDGFDEFAAHEDRRVVVLSGDGYEPIERIQLPASGYLLGTPGDLDGDGRGELVLAGDEVEAFAALLVFSRAPAIPIRLRVPDEACLAARTPQHWIVAPAGDFDGDGHADVAVGWPSCAEGRALVFSGSDGTLLFAAPYRASLGDDLCAEDFGASVLGGEDLNGDGLDDLVVGRPYGYLCPALLRAYACGRTGSFWSIVEWERRSENSNVGTALCFLPDRDGDGVPEILATGADYWEHGGVHPSGNVRILSGATGAELWFFHESDLPTFDRELLR